MLDELTAALDALAEYNTCKSFDKIIGSEWQRIFPADFFKTSFRDGIAMFKSGKLTE